MNAIGIMRYLEKSAGEGARSPESR
jgi:hypothetical protein